MQIFLVFFAKSKRKTVKYLHMCNNCCTFARFFVSQLITYFVYAGSCGSADSKHL